MPKRSSWRSQRGSVAAHQQGLVVGAGIVVGNPVAQHHVEDAGHLVGGGDDCALAAPARGDVAVEALERAVAGADGIVRGLEERRAQMP